MGNLTYEKDLTAHLIIDPYNDFVSEGGKLWIASRPSRKRTGAFRTCCRC